MPNEEMTAMTALSLTALVALGLGSFTRPLRRRQAAKHLSQLDDRLLKDIGLSRIDVEAMRRMW